MPATDKLREAFNTAMADSQEDVRSSRTARRDHHRLLTGPNLSGGIGPVRIPRSRVNTPTNADLEIVRLALRTMFLSSITADSLPRSTKQS